MKKILLVSILCIVCVAFFALIRVKNGEHPVTKQRQQQLEEMKKNGVLSIEAQSAKTADDAGDVVAFVGELESVKQQCDTDGECFVVVSGKRVVIGKSGTTETVGVIRGLVESTELETAVGTQVEVLAKMTSNDSYTLYGDSAFYIQILESTSGNEN
jgi:hypothetical protein